MKLSDEFVNRLASGSRDTNIIVWDVVNECGLYRLKGKDFDEFLDSLFELTPLSLYLLCIFIFASKKTFSHKHKFLFKGGGGVRNAKF